VTQKLKAQPIKTQKPKPQQATEAGRTHGK
jgi:hypothetical protein